MNIFEKYPYIVVEGPIGSGKSTLARLLATQFHANMFSEKAERNPFLPKFYEDMQHYALPTQLFFLFQRANQINELKQKDFFRNGVVADFFLQKDPIFARLNLDNEEFKKPIEKLLKKVDFKSKGLFVMNASLRSTHGNAFFTGFGKNKRIVFFDTLLKTITPDEMEAILGHELGHYKLGHIRKTLISSLVFGFIGFYILSEVLKSDNFFLDHGLESLTIYSKFLLFYLVAGSYTFFTRPFTSALSRKREFEADDFSFQYTNGEYMISGLLKLSKDNASNLTPDSLYSSYYYSHPPIAERVASIENKLK